VSAEPDPPVYAFGGFSLDATQRLLFGADGEPVPLTARAFDTLLFLVEHPNQLIDKQTLMKAVWPNVIVEENNLNQNILIARRALNEAPSEHRFIVTVPGRGFRFVAPVRRLSSIPQPDAPVAPQRDESRRASSGAERQAATTSVADVPANSAGAQRAKVRALRTLSLAAGGALVLGAVGYFLWDRTVPPVPNETRTQDAASVVIAAPTIAVLPFADMSPNRDQEYFADGLSEELSTYLSRLPGLRVIGRSSAFSFKGKHEDLRTIAKALGVKHILEGSVRKAGDQLRITAQLVDSSGTRVWSNTYDQKLGDVFAIQSQVAQSVAAALSVTLSAGDIDVARGGTRNVEAYDAWLAGRAIIASGTPDDKRRGIEQLERAVALDPEFALAWSSLAVTYQNAWSLPESGGAEWKAKGQRATSRALELAPDLPSVLAAAAMDSMRRRDWMEAEQRLQKARDLATGSENVWETSGIFAANVGRLREAVEYFRRAKLAEPLLNGPPAMLAAMYEASGDFDLAAAELTRSESLSGSPLLVQMRKLTLAMTRRDRAQIEQLISGLPASDVFTHSMRAHLDDPQAALTELRRAADDPKFSGNTVWLSALAMWAVYFGDPELSLQLLRNVPNDATFAWVVWRRILMDMRRLPGFKDLVRELRLVDYWRSSGNWGDFCRPIGRNDFECS
jgi:TolB-like protein/DNA-binding winged helix-turn-helix (wHTH) protein/Tfp pilus assembly protein PilF